MALYVSSARRLARTVTIAVAAATLAFALGWLVGNQQVPSVDERVATVKAEAADIATGVERLDIEYEQVLTGDDSAAGVVQPLADLRSSLGASLDAAPWVARATRDDLFDRFAAVESAARAEAPLEEFQSLITDAGDAVRAAFGIG